MTVQPHGGAALGVEREKRRAELRETGEQTQHPCARLQEGKLRDWDGTPVKQLGFAGLFWVILESYLNLFAGGFHPNDF